MQKMNSPEIDALLQLTLSSSSADSAVAYVAGLNDDERANLVALADSNHVVIRAFSIVAALASENQALSNWANGVLAKEQARIENALTFLHHICDELEAAGCPTTVMKSLDHWPDLGNDLDLYTTADEQQREPGDAEPAGRAHRAAQLGRSPGEQMEFCRSRPAGIGRSACPAAGTDRRAHGHGQAIRHPPRSQDGQRVDFPGSGGGGAGDRRHSAAHVPAFLFPRLRHREHGRRCWNPDNWISPS